MLQRTKNVASTETIICKMLAYSPYCRLFHDTFLFVSFLENLVEKREQHGNERLTSRVMLMLGGLLVDSHCVLKIRELNEIRETFGWKIQGLTSCAGTTCHARREFFCPKIAIFSQL